MEIFFYALKFSVSRFFFAYLTCIMNLLSSFFFCHYSQSEKNHLTEKKGILLAFCKKNYIFDSQSIYKIV